MPVPAGIEDGQTVRMPVGTKEIYITFRVEKSDYFTRKGADVHTEATISLAQVTTSKSVWSEGEQGRKHRFLAGRMKLFFSMRIRIQLLF